jgi:hypothetical protein
MRVAKQLEVYADLPDFTTAMDGGSVAIGREPMRPTAMGGGSVAIGRESMRPTAMDGGSAGAAGSGSSKNLEGLTRNVPVLERRNY